MEHSRNIRVIVNGKEHKSVVEPRLSLADFLRHHLRLTGTHIGCEHGVCGACTIIVNDEAVRSCLLFAVQADGARIETIEGLEGDAGLHPLQQAFIDHHGLQCGYCTPGILMTLKEFLRDHPEPSETEIREALSGNLCRCTGYHNIVAAALNAAAELRRARSGGAA